MRRWTDGKSWSASRVSGSFLTYREMEGKRGGSSYDKNANRDGVQGNEGDSDGGPDGYRYKPDGLMKQSFSITTNNGQHLHLISYFSRASATTQNLVQPTNDQQLRHIRPEKGMYPESTVNEQSTIPAVTRGPMGSPSYTHSPNQPSPYARAAPYGYGAQPGWAPPSPMHTPPAHSSYNPYFHQSHGHYPGQSSLQNMQYPPPHPPYNHPQMTAFDRPPPPLTGAGLPPPQQQYGHPPPPHNGYPGGYPYPASYQSYQPPPLQGPPAPYTAPQQAQPYDNKHQVTSQPSDPSSRRDDRPEAYQATRPSQPAPLLQPQVHSNGELQAQAGAPAPTPVSSGQTIPSISAMLNGGESGPPPARTSSRGSGATSPRPLQDIPVHKIGFEANRDVQALRNLDKNTFKGY